MCDVRNSVLASKYGNAIVTVGGHFESNIFWDNHAGFHVRPRKALACTRHSRILSRSFSRDLSHNLA